MATATRLAAEADALAERLEVGWQHIERASAEGSRTLPALEDHWYRLLDRFEMTSDWLAIVREQEGEPAPDVDMGALVQGRMAISQGVR